MGEKKKNKCSLKCVTCENYNKETDFCKEKGIENCSKKKKTDFAQCESYLVKHNLIMF